MGSVLSAFDEFAEPLNVVIAFYKRKGSCLSISGTKRITIYCHLLIKKERKNILTDSSMNLPLFTIIRRKALSVT